MTAGSGAIFAVGVLYAVGVVFVADFAWPIKVEFWWMWAITAVVAGLIYFQIRHSLA